MHLLQGVLPVENTNVRNKIVDQINHMLNYRVIRDRRFLDDEQLIRSEQLTVLEEIFNANVRDREIKEISSHFAPILENSHTSHLAIWGKTGTGKTLTVTYLLNLLSQMCKEHNVEMRYEYLDLSTPRPCFRALNDLACMLNACRHYKKGISLEELMGRIESVLADYKGYLILFIDEVDNVRRDRDAFLSFLVRRLPQKIPSKLILVFASNRLDWSDNLDPRTKSFLKINELIFQPYNAIDLQKILSIRVEKALYSSIVAEGVIPKVAAMAGKNHGDARKAVALLAQSAYLAEKAGSSITLDIVEQAGINLEQDKYISMIQTAPTQLQLALWSAIEAVNSSSKNICTTGESFDTYVRLCKQTNNHSLTARAFSDLIAELDMYTFLKSKVSSRGRYGRTREISIDLPSALENKLLSTIQNNF